MNNVLLGVAVTTSAIGVAVVIYIRLLKRKIKRFVLRNERIKKYFKRD
jgi:hypothetical protein